MATPPRLPTKRKYEDDAAYYELSGIAPLQIPALGNLRHYDGGFDQFQFNSELAAVHKLEARDRANRAAERKERLARRLRKELREARETKEEDEFEMSSSPLKDYEEHYGHGCEYDQGSTDDEDDKGSTLATNINNGAVNVNILCPH